MSPDRSKHGGLNKPAAAHTAATTFPGSYPSTPPPSTGDGALQSNGERPIQGADEDDFRSRAVPTPAGPSQAPRRQPPVPQETLANGEPAIQGEKQSIPNDRSQHLRTDRDIVSSNPPTTIPSRASVDLNFHKQLVTVQRHFDHDVNEILRSDFSERVMSLLDKAKEEFEADPTTYEQEYKDLVRYIIGNMVSNFDMPIEGYGSLL